MSVYENILKALKKGKIHMTLIDPATSGPEGSADIAFEAYKAGTDFIMLGGSTEISPEVLDKTTDLMKKKIDLEIILFPGSSSMITKKADAIARAGADIIVTGTVAEKTVNVYDTLKPIINIIHKTKN